jgi:hypothetical protein
MVQAQDDDFIVDDVKRMAQLPGVPDSGYKKAKESPSLPVRG